MNVHYQHTLTHRYVWKPILEADKNENVFISSLFGKYVRQLMLRINESTFSNPRFTISRMMGWRVSTRFVSAWYPALLASAMEP